MASRAIRVDERTFAALHALAEREQKPISTIVAELVNREATDSFWRAMREGYTRLRNDSAAWQDYLKEAALIEGGLVDGIDQVEPYYSPEVIAEIEQHAKSQGWYIRSQRTCSGSLMSS